MLEFSRAMAWSRWCAGVAGAAASIGFCGLSARADGPEIKPEPLKDISHIRWQGCPGYPCKEAKSPPQAGMRKDAIIVKFNADAKVRLRAEGLVDLGTGQIKDAAVQTTLAKYAALGCRWAKMHETVSEDKLDQMRDTAMRNLGKMLTDMNAEMFLFVPAGVDRATAIDDFNALSIVEMAEEAPDAAPLPAAGDYRGNQGYLKIASEGMGSYSMRLLAGGTGNAVRISDCEYSWNTAHIDLPAVTSLVANASDPFADNNHGTAVLGEMGSRRDGVGTEGGAYGATFYVAAANTTTLGYNLANAITASAAVMSGGDIILIEQQTTGPNYTGVPAGTQFGLVPSEWQQSVYNAIVAAIGNGLYVVSAAGNGSQDLDSAPYGVGHGGFYPFQAANDSGDIIVGAGCPPVGGSSTDRSRLGFSCYGSTVDLQGYGEGVYTTGYGDLYNATVNERYTAGFSGTSSASPTVVNAVAMFSSVYETRYATFPSPGYGRNQLRNFGTAQQGGANPASQNIGPRPNALSAWNGILTPGFPPANNICASAIDTSSHGTFIGYTCGASNDATGGCSSSTSPDVWYTYTAPVSVGGTLVVTSCGTHDYGFTDQGIDTVMSIWSACGGTELSCNDDTNTCGGALGSFRDSSVSAPVLAGQQVLIRVANFSASVSGPFQLTVQLVPSNDACASAIDVSNGGTFFATTAGSTNDGTASCGSSATNGDVWFTYTACDSGTLHVDTCGTHDAPGVNLGMDTVLSILSACGGTQLACNDDALAGLPCGASDTSTLRDSKIDLAMTAGQIVKLRVAKFGTSVDGNFRLNVSFNAAHDTCGTAQLLAVQTATPFSNTCMTSDGFTENLCLAFGSADITNDMWFYFFAPSTGPMRIQTCGSLFDTKVGIYDNFCPVGNNSASIIACNDDACGTQSIVNFQAIAGHDYGVRVGGYAGARGTGTIIVLCPADYNRDGAINVQDIFDFLAGWFAGNPAANTNGVNGIGVQDIFDFLALWFAGC